MLMRTKTLPIAIIFLLFAITAIAQTGSQPFADLGKKVKVLTLTNGKYEEFFDDDSIQQIGTALINIKTMEVVKFQLTKAEQKIIDNSAVSRFLSVDPLAKSFAMLTPYQYASNSPILGVDLDGLEFANAWSRLKAAVSGVAVLKLNNIDDGFGDIQQQDYNLRLSGPENNTQTLYNKIATDINSIYGTDRGIFSFRNQQAKNEVSKNDYIEINPGIKSLDFFVKVTDVQKYDEKNPKQGVDAPHKGFSVTFRTLQGHVEVGAITFTALQFNNSQTGETSFEFDISSTTRINHGVAAIVKPYSREAQQEVWHQVLKNVYNFMGGTVESAGQGIWNYNYKDFNKIDNNGTTLGAPADLANPTKEFKDYKDIKLETNNNSQKDDN